MINQIHHVQTKTEPLPKINRGLMQARHIQAVVKERIAGHSLPVTVEIWNPLTVSSYTAPVTRWIE
jgi:hypothetical protein